MILFMYNSQTGKANLDVKSQVGMKRDWVNHDGVLGFWYNFISWSVVGYTGDLGEKLLSCTPVICTLFWIHAMLQ